MGKFDSKMLPKARGRKRRPKGPSCPQCWATVEDGDLALSETYVAWHRIDEIVGDETGEMMNVASAFNELLSGFDDGAGDYAAVCRRCGREGTIAEFRLPGEMDFVR